MAYLRRTIMSGSHKFVFSMPAIMLLGVSAAMCASTAAADDAAGGVQAAWQSYDLNFPYMGMTTYYSCTGLEDRLEQILKDLGARPDVRVSAMGCAGNEVSRSLWTRIRVSLPTQTGGTGEPFAVTSKQVMLKTHTLGQVGSGDCELLEQVRDRLLPQLKLKAEGDNLVCVPGQVTIGVRTLQVAALIPAPALTH